MQPEPDQNFITFLSIVEKQDSNFQYFAYAGTLLGLIRDEALIPWDHDIDIALMPNANNSETV